MYDLRRLRSLCAIADHGSLTAAADALTFTQPAVSQHLAALEAEVGAPLVTRSRGGAELTDAGRLLVEHARAALDRLALAEVQVVGPRRARAAARPARGPLLVADPADPAGGRRPAAAAPRRRGHDPRGRPARGARRAAQRRRRPRGHVPPRGDGGARRTSRSTCCSRSRCTPSSRAPTRSRTSAEIDLAGLRDDPWIQGPSSTSPGLIRELCRDAGFEPRIAFESDDPLATRGIVAAGLAVSLVPSMTKEDTARDRNVRVLPLRDPPRRRVVAADHGRRPHDAGDRRDGRRRSPAPEPGSAGPAASLPRMAARIIDGKAIAQQVRAEVKEDVADWVAKGNLDARAGDGAGRRRPRLRRLRRQQAEGLGRGRDRRPRPPAAPGRLPRGGRDADPRSSPPPSACPGSCSSSRPRARSTARR